MSYEILLYPRTHGQDWVEVVAADEADGPDLDQATLNRGVAVFRRIEARLLEQVTEPIRTWVPEALDGDVLGELQTRDSRLRVELYDRSALVSAPYGGPDAPVHDLIRQAVEIVAAETGYQAYDPQVRASFDGSFDDEAGLASLSGPADQDDLWAESGPHTGHDDATSPDATTASPLEGQVVVDQGLDHPLDPRTERARLIQERREQLLEQRRDPAALRRRGWFYVVFGVIVTGLGLLRLSGGESEGITWLFLGVGVFELVSAWLLFSQARRAEMQRQEASLPGRPPGSSDDAPDEDSDGPIRH